MLILDRASENKLEELVLVSRKLNGVLRENYPGVHKIEPDRAALLWCAIDDEIEKRQKQIDKILATESGAEQIVLRRACRELKKEYDQYNQLMEEVYNEELLPATIPELLISSVQRATLEMQEINKNLQHTKEAMKPWDYSRWSYSIGKDSMYVAILRDVGDGNVQRTEFRHVRENHRIISKECTVLAKTHAKGKRLRCGRPQSRQPDSDHKRKNDQ